RDSSLQKVLRGNVSHARYSSTSYQRSMEELVAELHPIKVLRRQANHRRGVVKVIKRIVNSTRNKPTRGGDHAIVGQAVAQMNKIPGYFENRIKASRFNFLGTGVTMHWQGGHELFDL